MSKLLSVRGVSKSYHDGTRELKVLESVDLEIDGGETVAIVGMSGAGKSTFLHLVGGLDHPDAGTIFFEGEEITKWPRARMNEYRSRSIGFVFQFHHLMPEFNALENAMMPGLVARKSRAEAEAKARELLGVMGLAERERHRPGQLSGGEQQRVALARALVNEPKLVLADEPTGNLDPRTGDKVIETLWKTTAETGRSLIIVTHEPAIAQRANKIFALKNQKLVKLSKDEVRSHMAEAAPKD